MIISYRHRFVFVKTRKTAGTSVEIALSEHAGPRDVLTRFALREDNDLRRQRGADAQNQAVPLRRYGVAEWKMLARRGARSAFRSHMPAAAIRRLTPPGLWEEFFTFTIVRNPWDTAASAYFWQTRALDPKPSFTTFLETQIGNWNNWPLYTIDGAIAVDHVIRYEDLDVGLAAVCDRLGLPALDLPKAKSGLRRAPYQELYGAEERRLVARVCRAEIDYFGFGF